MTRGIPPTLGLGNGVQSAMEGAARSRRFLASYDGVRVTNGEGQPRGLREGGVQHLSAETETYEFDRMFAYLQTALPSEHDGRSGGSVRYPT